MEKRPASDSLVHGPPWSQVIAAMAAGCKSDEEATCAEIDAQRAAWTGVALEFSSLAQSAQRDMQALAREFLAAPIRHDPVCKQMAHWVLAPPLITTRPKPLLDLPRKQTTAASGAEREQRAPSPKRLRVLDQSLHAERSGTLKASVHPQVQQEKEQEKEDVPPDAVPKTIPTHQEEKKESESPVQEEVVSPPLDGNLHKQMMALADRLQQYAPELDVEQARLRQMSQEIVQLLQQTMYSAEHGPEATESILTQICQGLGLSSCKDDVLFSVSRHLVETNWSAQFARIFIRTALLPRLNGCSSVISRVLLRTVVLFCDQFVDIVVSDLLVPLLHHQSASIGAAQGEAVTRILREGIRDRSKWESFLLQVHAQAAESEGFLLLSGEGSQLVYQSLLNDKSLQVSDQIIGGIVQSIERCVEAEPKVRRSAKFATLVFTLVTKYPQQCRRHLESLQTTTGKLETFMAKSIMRSIQKLKAS